MLAPNDLIAAAEAIFAAPSVASAARSANFQIQNVKAVASPSWRLLHQEVPPAIPVHPPMFGESPAAPARQTAVTRLWSAHNARFTGRRGLVAQDGALFLGGPVRNETDLKRAIAECATGGEGMFLRQTSPVEAQLLSTIANGDRRLTGTGLFLGAPVGVEARPFLLDRFAALLLIAELKPKLDYVVLADAEPEFESVLAELGLERLKILNLDQLQGVLCSEVLIPVIAQDPAGWVDTATIGRLRGFAAGVLAKMGPGVHAEPAKIFLTPSNQANSPLAAIAARKGYEVRSLSGRGVVDQAVLMSKASVIVTDSGDDLISTLLADASVPVLDLIGENGEARVAILAGAGRPYAFAPPDQAEEALARITATSQKAA